MVTEIESRMESLRVQLDRARQTALNERVPGTRPSRCACAACKSQACTHAQGTRLAWPSGDLRRLRAWPLLQTAFWQVRIEADADVVREREQVAALHAEVRRRVRFVVALVRAARRCAGARPQGQAAHGAARGCQARRHGHAAADRSAQGRPRRRACAAARAARERSGSGAPSVKRTGVGGTKGY